MTKSIEFISCTILVLCSCICLTGCSVIGYNIGNTLDPAYSAEQPRVRQAVSTLPRNTKIVIQKTDGTKVEGTYLGTGQVVDTIAVDQYSNCFEQWRFRNELESRGCVPPFGSFVMIRVNAMGRHQAYTGRFAGFDPGMIRIHSTTQGRTLPLKLEFVQGMDDSLGHVIATREEIVGVVSHGVPFASRVEFTPGILLKEKPGIPFNEIEAIRGGGDGRWFGLAVGIAADIAVVSALATLAVDSMTGWPSFK